MLCFLLQMSTYSNDLFPVLLGILSDTSDEVVLQGLIVLAEIVNSTKNKGSEFNQAQYRKFLVSLLNLFSDDKVFLEKRGSLIIRWGRIKHRANELRIS
jgi:vacuole morphology and inheritance protein 14